MVLEAYALQPQDLDMSKTEFLVEDVIVKESITMIYGAPSQGKTWFMYAIAKFLVREGRCKRLYYIDMDNGKRQLRDRGVAQKLLVDGLVYVSKSKIPKAPAELLEDLKKEAYGRNFEDVVLVFDSTRDFVDNTKNDLQAKRFMEIMKDLREAGATVLLIHHATKSGKVIEGSAEFTKSADNVYELRQQFKSGTKLYFQLKVEHDRDPIKNATFCVDTKSYALSIGEDAFGDMSEEEIAFVRNVVRLLHQHPKGLNQTKILAAIGKARDDKKARALIERFRGRFWEAQRIGKEKIFQAI